MDLRKTSFTQLEEKSKLSYSIASLLQSVGRNKEASSLGDTTEDTEDHPGEETDNLENNDESDGGESDISVDSHHDNSEDDRLAAVKHEPEEDDNRNQLLRLPPHLLGPPGLLPHPLHHLLPPGWPPVHLLQQSLASVNHNRTELGKSGL